MNWVVTISSTDILISEYYVTCTEDIEIKYEFIEEEYYIEE